MQNFKLANGYRITAQRTNAMVEFVTYNPAGDAISTVYKPFAEATPYIRRLQLTAR